MISIYGPMTDEKVEIHPQNIGHSCFKTIRKSNWTNKKVCLVGYNPVRWGYDLYGSMKIYAILMGVHTIKNYNILRSIEDLQGYFVNFVSTDCIQ
jgi:hypothetical protein